MAAIRKKYWTLHVFRNKDYERLLLAIANESCRGHQINKAWRKEVKQQRVNAKRRLKRATLVRDIRRLS